MEKTFAMVKPDGVRRRLVGEVIKRYESAGFDLLGIEMKTLSREEAERLYAVHRERPFYGELVEFITAGPVVLMVLAGEGVIATVREIMGATNPAEAAKGSIRGDFGGVITENIVHGSDSGESASYEIPIFFPDLA